MPYVLVMHLISDASEMIRRQFSQYPILLVNLSSDTDSARGIHGLSIKELKSELAALSVDISSLLEKSELRSALEKARTRRGMRFVSLSDTRCSAPAADKNLFGEMLYFLDRTAEFTQIRRWFTTVLGVPERPQVLAQMKSRMSRIVLAHEPYSDRRAQASAGSRFRAAPLPAP